MRALCHFASLFKLHFLRLCALACLLLPVSSWAIDHILEKAYWTDSTANASFEQARAASYTPYANLLSKGYSPSAQWVRLKIQAVTPDEPDAAESLVLRIRPIYLDEILLFDPADEKNQGKLRAVGDRSAWESAEFESLNHTFLIPALAQDRYVWLRLSTTSTHLMQVEALTPREMLREEHRILLFYALLLSLIFSFLVWVLLAWLRDHDPVNGMFILRQTVLLLYTASYLGFHRILLHGILEPSHLDVFYNWLVLLTTALSVAFEYRLLREYRLPGWASGSLKALLLASAVAMSLMLLGYTRAALNTNMLINAIALLSFLVVSLNIRPHDAGTPTSASYRLSKNVLIGYYLVIVLVLAMSILPSLGILAGTMLSVYGVLMYGLISGLVMTSLLMVRSHQIEKIKLDVANNLFLSREQLAIEQQRRQSQSQLLSMLMHELKTPLSIIDMAVTTQKNDARTAGYVSRSVANIKSILDRCIQTDRMVEHEFKLQSQPVQLSQQLRAWVQERKEEPSRFDTDIADGCLLSSDIQCLQIIVNNLIDNAFKHGDPLGQVQLNLSPSLHADGRAGVLLCVVNQPGPSGWPDPDQLFGKYYRSGAAQRVSGTGLGLYLAHNLAGQLGGSLRFAPNHSNIRFELWLPA